MKKSTLILCLFLVLGLANQLSAQSYKSAIGARLGYPVSLSYKQFISNQGAIELIAGYRGYAFYRWFNVGALYEHHMGEIKGLDGLNWYIGGGGSAYFFSFDDAFIGDGGTSTSFALLGVIGLDYKFKNYPINLSLDWMPAFFLNGFGNGFDGGYGGLSVRYTLR